VIADRCTISRHRPAYRDCDNQCRQYDVVASSSESVMSTALADGRSSPARISKTNSAVSPLVSSTSALTQALSGSVSTCRSTEAMTPMRTPSPVTRTPSPANSASQFWRA
jgi:hypothetical protein